MRAALFAVPLLLLAACDRTAPKPETEPAQPSARTDGSIASPSLEAATVTLGRGDSGRELTVAAGSVIQVQLRGVPTAGYIWEASEIPPFMSEAGGLTGPTREEQLEPGFAGGSHWEVLGFSVDAAGTGELALIQHRPWETDQPPNDTFAITVTAE